jgi:DNA ligase-1
MKGGMQFINESQQRELVDFYLGESPPIHDVAIISLVPASSSVFRGEVLVGEPIRPMLAERFSSPEEILEKLGGKCVAEYKYDGERIQAHKKGKEVVLFSRRLENISDQYPDAIELLNSNL